MAKDKLALNAKGHRERKCLNSLELSYKDYLERHSKENSFSNGDLFLLDIKFNDINLPEYGFKNRRELTRKLTLCDPPSFYD